MKKVLLFCTALALLASALPSMAVLVGENCANPITVTGLPYSDTTRSTCPYANSTNPTCDGASGPGDDVVYQYVAPVDQRASISLCGSSFNTLLYVFDGSPCDNSHRIACNNNSSKCGTGSNRSYLECLQMLANHAYYIVVDATDNARDEGDGEGDGSERCPCGNYKIRITLCGEPPYTDVDMGDLPCGYPTLTDNPGHGLSGVAWLGDLVTSEGLPYPNDTDPRDDGVDFLNALWWEPCHSESLTVKVTAGQYYSAYADTGGLLYLNAWKDGNHDGDFCDTLCGGQAPEWFLQNSVVIPRAQVYGFRVIDPGVESAHRYDGIFRFRLTSRALDEHGFGLVVAGACPIACGSFDLDFLGEVEDYVMRDFQLAAEMGNFDAIAGQDRVTLRWNTLSERNNDHFDIERNGSIVTHVNGLGDSPNGHAYEWVDNAVQASATYSYTLYAVDVNGTRRQMATASATPTSEPVTVTEYALYQNYPNPFNPKTNIVFDLVESGTVTLTVYNPMGQQVAQLVNGSLNMGRHAVSFDASNLPSGMYLYRLETPSFSATRKMLLMK